MSWDRRTLLINQVSTYTEIDKEDPEVVAIISEKKIEIAEIRYAHRVNEGIIQEQST